MQRKFLKLLQNDFNLSIADVHEIRYEFYLVGAVRVFTTPPPRVSPPCPPPPGLWDPAWDRVPERSCWGGCTQRVVAEEEEEEGEEEVVVVEEVEEEEEEEVEEGEVEEEVRRWRRRR